MFLLFETGKQLRRTRRFGTWDRKSLTSSNTVTKRINRGSYASTRGQSRSFFRFRLRKKKKEKEREKKNLTTNAIELKRVKPFETLKLNGIAQEEEPLWASAADFAQSSRHSVHPHIGNTRPARPQVRYHPSCPKLERVLRDEKKCKFLFLPLTSCDNVAASTFCPSKHDNSNALSKNNSASAKRFIFWARKSPYFR